GSVLSFSRPTVLCSSPRYAALPALLSFPTRRSSDLCWRSCAKVEALNITVDEPSSPPLEGGDGAAARAGGTPARSRMSSPPALRSEEHTSELQSLRHLVCRLLLEKKKNQGQSTEAMV